MTLTDEQLAAIKARLETLEKGGSLCGGWEGFVWASAPATDIRALLDEVTALRHDVTRHMEIANEHLAEVERLRALELGRDDALTRIAQLGQEIDAHD